MKHLAALFSSDLMTSAFGVKQSIEVSSQLEINEFFNTDEYGNITPRMLALYLYFASFCNSAADVISAYPDNEEGQIIEKCVYEIQRRLETAVPDGNHLKDLQSVLIGRGFVQFRYLNRLVEIGKPVENDLKHYSGDWFRKLFLLYYETKVNY